MQQHWPSRLWLVRHGQSQGNVARDEAHQAGELVIDLDWRDVDVPLSELGQRQAEAAGRWFAALPDVQALEAFHLLAEREGIIPALESAHALWLALRRAREGEVVVVGLSGRGDKDVDAVEAREAGR